MQYIKIQLFLLLIIPALAFSSNGISFNGSNELILNEIKPFSE